MIQFKTANKLFKGLYQYKIVLIVPGASIFRTGDMDATYRQIKQIDLKTSRPGDLQYYKSSIKTQDDLDYIIGLHAILKNLTDVEVRVESPWVSVYTNVKNHVDKLTKLDEQRVKYTSGPPPGGRLEEGVIILPNIDFEFKVTVGKTSAANEAFIEWAETNPKVRLTKKCIADLSRPRSWGGGYFYITGEKNLLMAKMHLGGSINKVERIVKS